MTVSGRNPGIRKRSTFQRVASHWQLYVMGLPAMVLLFLFSYMPMGGLVIAFKDFKSKLGIFGSPWMDPLFKNFEVLFRNNQAALVAIRNTLLLNLLFIFAGTIFALALSLMFNEIRSKWFKRLSQSITFLPYFISTVVVGVFAVGLLNFETGTINHLRMSFGGDPINWYMEPKYWPVILLCVNIWKGAGYSAVVYLATISGIDSSYYEAAQVDGATRWEQMWYISLPLLRPTVVVMTLLAIGRIMNADFGLFFNVTRDVPTLYPTTDVIDTFIYRTLRQTGDIGISSATGFFQSCVSFVLVLTCNKLARMFEAEAALF